MFTAALTYHFVSFTWIFFRSASLQGAWDILGRIASLSVGFENVTWRFAAILAAAALSLFARKQWYGRAMEAFAACPFYVHAAALLLVAVAIQFLGGRGGAPFVYSRF